MGHFSASVERPTLNSKEQDAQNPYSGYVVEGGEFVKIDSSGVQTNLDIEEVQEEKSNGSTRNRCNIS